MRDARRQMNVIELDRPAGPKKYEHVTVSMMLTKFYWNSRPLGSEFYEGESSFAVK